VNRPLFFVLVPLLLLSSTTVPAAGAAAVQAGSANGGNGSADTAEQAGEEAVTFAIWEFRVEGNTVLPTVEIEKAVYPFLGEARTVDDVFAAEGALNQLYQDAGYVSVQVYTPEQDVDQGVVRFEVVEAPVGRNRVVGSEYHDLGRVRKGLPSLAPGEVPHLPTFQRELEKLNRRGNDRAVAASLAAGIRPGTVDADIRVQDQIPVHGSVEVNDRFTRNTSRVRTVGSIRYTNLWQREHTLGLTYQESPQNPGETRVLSFNYSLPVGEKNTLFAYAVDSSSDVLAFNDAGGVGITGNGSIYGARWIRSLPQIGQLFNSMTFGLDYKTFEDTVAPESGGGLVTPVKYLKGIVGYGGLLLGVEPEVRFGIDVNFGTRGVVASEARFDDKRFQAKPNFLFLTGRFSIAQSFMKQHEVFLRVNGQLTEDPLIANEQYSLGGFDSVRGYVASQSLVDYGFDGAIEYRYAPEALAGMLPDWIGTPRFDAFVDGALGKIHVPLPDTDSRTELASVGFGVTASANPGLISSLYWAMPLIDSNDIESGDSRLHFRFGMQF